jgi:uncharacterized protein (TIGR03382 family)
VISAIGIVFAIGLFYVGYLLAFRSGCDSGCATSTILGGVLIAVAVALLGLSLSLGRRDPHE